MIARYGNFEFALAERYRFEGELGRGAMGTVYLARDVRLGRSVAIKMLHPTLTNELGVKRFQGEIRIAAGLHHPNIIGVHESGEADGRLFYVMDYLGGETLRDRLKREKQLSVEDALRITEQVAEGLQYAHDHGVVHRDVKPENIILAEGRAYVVDFGLARALGDVDAQRLTASGLAVGTPHYLSPEQASAEREIGPAADQYGLACVLYEMLVGEPPFTGPTASAIAMRHISETAAPLRARRRTAPVSLDAAVARAMEKVPADRFGTVTAFSKALLRPPVGAADAEAVSASTRTRAWTFGAIVAAMVVIAVVVSSRWTDITARPADLLSRTFGPALDTTRYVVLPFRREGSEMGDLHETEILYDAVARWDGVHPVELYQVSDAVRRQETTTLSSAVATRVARTLGAGRFIWGEVSRSGELIRVHATVFDTNRPDEPLGDATVRLNKNGLNADSLLALVADSLLFGRKRPASGDDVIGGTRSRPARQAFLRGLEATSSWDLATADSAFQSASVYDPQYSRALFWLAQVRAWGGPGSPDLRRLTEHAAADPRRLSQRELQLARALVALSAEQYDKACTLYEQLKTNDSTMFAAWYGIGECNAKDDMVVRTGAGWRFRSSYRRALDGYERAFTLLPSINRSFSARAYSRLQELLKTSVSDLRLGHSQQPDTLRFAAYPSWEGDTLAFMPIPFSALAEPTAIPASLGTAIDHQRHLFNRIAGGWVASLPGDPSALEALAISLELLGDRASLDTLRRARIVATDGSQQLRLAAREVWLRVKFAVPDSLDEIVGARNLADSILTKTVPKSSADALVLLNLASLTGQVQRAITLSRKVAPPTVVGVSVPESILRDALELQIYAAFGGPMNLLKQAGLRLEEGIQGAVRPELRAEVRQRLLSRAAMLSFPDYVPRSLDSVDRAGDQLLLAQTAYMQRDSSAVRQQLNRLTLSRVRVRPADIALDALIPEAWLLASIGDIRAAIERIDPTLQAVHSFGPNSPDSFTRAVALGRAMRLRAGLAQCARDEPVKRRWQAANQAMWSSKESTFGSAGTGCFDLR